MKYTWEWTINNKAQNRKKGNIMKKIIQESGMTIKEFSEHYEIPYNTVRQYCNGNRNAPDWVVKLMREKIEREKCGSQLSLFP